jgi:hypothetical protein
VQRSLHRSWRKPPKPHFYWQGTLIVLPALLLAASGLSTLRQDRVLAQHQATEEANALASALSEHLIKELVPPGLLDGSRLEKWRAAPSAAADDPVLRLANVAVPGVACFAGEDGRMLYPELPAVAPRAAPLDETELTPEQRTEWRSLLAWWNDPAATPPSADRLSAFAALKPPPRFIVVAQMRIAAVMSRDGAASEAVALLQAAIAQAGDAPGESGYPLRVFARLQMLPLLPTAECAAAADAICGEAVVRASLLAPALLERAGEAAPSVLVWEPVSWICASLYECTNLLPILRSDQAKCPWWRWSNISRRYKPTPNIRKNSSVGVGVPRDSIAFSNVATCHQRPKAGKKQLVNCSSPVPPRRTRGAKSILENAYKILLVVQTRF